MPILASSFQKSSKLPLDITLHISAEYPDETDMDQKALSLMLEHLHRQRHISIILQEYCFNSNFSARNAFVRTDAGNTTFTEYRRPIARLSSSNRLHNNYSKLPRGSTRLYGKLRHLTRSNLCPTCGSLELSWSIWISHVSCLLLSTKQLSRVLYHQLIYEGLQSSSNSVCLSVPDAQKICWIIPEGCVSDDWLVEVITISLTTTTAVLCY